MPAPSRQLSAPTRRRQWRELVSRQHMAGLSAAPASHSPPTSAVVTAIRRPELAAHTADESACGNTERAERTTLWRPGARRGRMPYAALLMRAPRIVPAEVEEVSKPKRRANNNCTPLLPRPHSRSPVVLHGHGSTAVIFEPVASACGPDIDSGAHRSALPSRARTHIGPCSTSCARRDARSGRLPDTPHPPPTRTSGHSAA